MPKSFGKRFKKFKKQAKKGAKIVKTVGQVAKVSGEVLKVVGEATGQPELVEAGDVLKKEGKQVKDVTKKLEETVGLKKRNKDIVKNVEEAAKANPDLSASEVADLVLTDAPSTKKMEKMPDSVEEELLDELLDLRAQLLSSASKIDRKIDRITTKLEKEQDA
jgi:hypothetical protein